MREVSVTVTCGSGSEKHNHDLEYRATLDHVKERDNAVVEMTEYVAYKDKINDLMKPYIDQYNAKVDERYAAAWDRFNSGQIKTKPRKRDFKKMDYDYYDQHKDDKVINPNTKKEESLPIFRSMIIGLGDQADRQNISEEEAIGIFADIYAALQKDFPDLHTLGFTVHLDEEGFYHAHWDYKPVMAFEFSKGLQATVSQDTVLEQMGFEPEQSIINGRDKAPLLFNALRNKVYRIAEDAMDKHKIRLQYGITSRKYPGKDSSKNQKLSDWQLVQDQVRKTQHIRNEIVDITSKEVLSEEDYVQVTKDFQELGKTLHEVENSPRSRLNKDNIIISFNLFEQLKNYFKAVLEKINHVYHLLSIAQDNAEYYAQFEQLYYDQVEENKKLKSMESQIEKSELIRKAERYETLEKSFPNEIKNLNQRLGNFTEWHY